MKIPYIAIAVFSIVPALILAFFLIPRLGSGMVADLAWITFLLLIFNFFLSLTILFVEEKFRLIKDSKRKS